MAQNEVTSLKKALKQDINSAECFIMLADMEAYVEAANSPKQPIEARETIISSLVSLKQSISANTEKLMAEIDNAISKMS